ncbi:long-chain fatty acid--CoA ligase [Blastococcus sp. Marseille-P5729]|uniref:AMP-dependent synthetase/ligase n=1 Tax=Blastococcus sp. Marseille-P5729 TaxID=2086582 RepID=UPI000D10456F|nr:long-chain fatty acid--CoA ligase [Blastococcus sp. Marseille-P5729]
MTLTTSTTTPESAPHLDWTALENRVPSVGHLFRDRVKDSPQREAYRYERDGEWKSLTWSETKDLAYSWAAGLIALGVGPQDRVAIASSTRFEWAIADLAVMCAGGATTTVYPTTIAGDVAYILGDSESKVVIAEDDEQIAKLREKRDELAGVVKVVTFDGTADGDWVITIEDLAALGRQQLEKDAGVVDSRIDALRPEDLATIIYTSGTTGRPKGVRLPHSAWTYAGSVTLASGLVNEDDLQYLWLPLAHVFGKVLLTLPLASGTPTAIDGRIDKIIDNLAVVKPTFMGAAPRIFEKAYARINQVFEAESGLKRKIIDWGTQVAHEADAQRQAGKQPGGLKYSLADKLVLSKVRERFGGRLRFMISGSAPLNVEINKWFGAMGLQILEGYGLTETSAIATLNLPGELVYGSVGKPTAGTAIKIAEDGEILIKGDQVMMGYHNKPDATSDALADDGWFHTGDIGHLSSTGHLFITDRKKELFKTSGGKFIAPAQIESRFKGICPLVSQFMVAGDAKNFATALVTLDPDAIAEWAKRNDMEGKSYAEIATSEKMRETIQKYVDELNSGLNRWETIKKFVILDRDLTVEDGDLTPSLKLKRRVVAKKYQAEIDALYKD